MEQQGFADKLLLSKNHCWTEADGVWLAVSASDATNNREIKWSGVRSPLDAVGDALVGSVTTGDDQVGLQVAAMVVNGGLLSVLVEGCNSNPTIATWRRRLLCLAIFRW